MDFMILGLPRSGTTWAANWLSSDGAICYHDPFAKYDDVSLTNHNPGREWGISCTGAWLFPSFMQANKCKTIILERDLNEVNQSLREIGWPEFPADLLYLFRKAEGKRMPFNALFDEEGAREIWQHLRPGKPFDVVRWKQLIEMSIQPNFDVWSMDANILEKMAGRIGQ